MGSRLQGKAAIVTGGGGGLGKGIATKFVEEGARVLIADVSEASAEAAATAIGCEYIQADATKSIDWQNILKKALDLYGRVDIVVNNAGGTYTTKPTVGVEDAEFDLCVNLNMRTIYQSVKVIVPQMQKQGNGGVFITIASTAGIRPRVGLTWYNSSKAAASCATKTLALEFAKEKIRFNSVCPVAADTGMLRAFLGTEPNEQILAAPIATIPMGRLCSPQDIGNACCYLACDESSFVTGIELNVDGGRTV